MDSLRGGHPQRIASHNQFRSRMMISEMINDKSILITGGTDGFRRRVVELNVIGDDIVAETEAVDMDEIYLVAQFRKQVVIAPQPHNSRSTRPSRDSCSEKRSRASGNGCV